MLSTLLTQYSEEAQASIPTQACGNIGEKADDTGTGQYTQQHGFATGVHAIYGKRVLCQINVYGGNGLHGMPPAKGFWVTYASSFESGQGRPITLAEIVANKYSQLPCKNH